MKTNTLALLVLGIGLSTAWAADTVLFDDRFEGDNLDRWDGIISGAHHGTIVVDPLRPRNHVLTFTEWNQGGDVLTLESFSVGAAGTRYLVSFDYLGLAQPGSVPDNLGGFLGIYVGVTEPHYWIAGTDSQGINVTNGVELIDDGQWHHYEIDITPIIQSAGLTRVRLMAEDWGDSGGVPGDVYFDNIRLTAQMHRAPRLEVHVTEATVCWESEGGLTYQLQYRSARTPGGWVAVGPPVAGTGERICVADRIPLGEPQRLYRVRED